MSREVERFIERLKDYKSFEVKEYECEKYHCEISTLLQNARNNNYSKECLEIWKKVYSNKFFELKHPIHNHITTRAIANFLHPRFHINYIIFTDKEEKFTWLTLQLHGIADCFITEDIIYIEPFITQWGFRSATLGRIGQLFDFVNKDTFAKLSFADISFGLCFDNLRPGHYFRDDLHWFFQLSMNEINKEIWNVRAFFIPKNIHTKKNINYVYIAPRIYCNMDLTLTSKICVDESLENFNSLINPQDNINYCLTLWIGIPGERRIWLEQWEGIPLILKNLSLYFPSIKVYVDGMTAYDGERIEVTSNLEAFWKIVENTKEVFEVPASLADEASVAKATNPHLQIHNTESHPQDSKNSCVIYGAKGEQIAFKSLSGYDYRTKICYCTMCDIAISETSTTSLVPFDFCKKPGVAFYGIYQTNHMLHINMARDFAKQIPHLKVPLPKYHRYERDTRSIWHFNYHLPPEHLYNLAAESLEELSLEGKLANFGKDNPLKMHRLSVPPVELYSKLYELEKKTQVSLKGNKAEREILEKIESQKKLLEMQKLVSELEKSEKSVSQIAKPSTKETPKPRGAKERVHHHLAYKLGVALIVCSKSLWGYITMPYVLSYIKAQHQFEQEKYQKAVARNPALKLPKLESYADYEDALKEKQCYTYKLGEALMEADKTWLKGGYLWFYFESKRLKKLYLKNKENNKAENCSFCSN